MTLAEYRAERGLTLQQIADALGLSKSRMSEIENGSGCSLPTAVKIERYTKGLVRPSDLLSKENAA